MTFSRRKPISRLITFEQHDFIISTATELVCEFVDLFVKMYLDMHVFLKKKMVFVLHF